MEAVKRIIFGHLKNTDTSFKKLRQNTFCAIVRAILFLERNTSLYFLVMSEIFAVHGVFELSIKCLIHSYHLDCVKKLLPSRPYNM